MNYRFEGVVWRIDWEVDGKTKEITKVWLDDGNGQYKELSKLPLWMQQQILTKLELQLMGGNHK